MMGHKLPVKLMVVIVIAAAACESVSASILEDDNQLLDKRVVNGSSQHLSDKIHSKSSSVKNVTTTAKHEKKMMHLLIGGHVKLHQKLTPEVKNERESTDEGLTMSSAGNGKEKPTSNRRDEDDEEKKTLSQQVKEGKYGLIQNEIYPKPPKRPGIISYLSNPEVPKDNAKNFGGLDEDEIWLAENHLLVLRGGKFPDHGTKPVNNQAQWAPIDDYKAPLRQVKIPERPEVPPPFPVQLTEGGPVQIIRANGSVFNVNDTIDYDDYANYPEGFYPGEAPFYPFSSNSTDLGYPGNFTTGNGSYLPPFSGAAEGTVGPFYPALPPGAVFLPPPDNQSNYEDDDQSIYYPPPYSFYYKQDNASSVPAGPLVPGIILPPPPNFFSSLGDNKSGSKTKSERLRITTTTEAPEETTTYKPSTVPPRRKTVTKPYKVRFSSTTQINPTLATSPKPTTRIRPGVKNIVRTKPREFSTLRPSIRFASTPRYVETTTSRPEKPTTISQSDYYDVKTEVENHLIDLGEPQPGPWSGIVGSTAVPLVAYYATTSSPLERTRSTDEISPIHVKANIPSKNQASYYYYEETSKDKPVQKTTTDSPQIYFKTSTEETSPYYKVETISTQRQPKKQYYSVEMLPSQQTADDYDIKFSTLIKNTQNYNDYSNPSTNYNVERPGAQSQSTVAENSHNYYQPSSTIKPYYTTQRPRYYYQTSESENQYDYRDEDEVKSSPVYQYSYESSDYANKREKQNYRQQEISDEPTVYTDYNQQPRITSGQYYDYETRAVEKVQKTQEIPYLGQRPSYPSENRVRIVNTTPNPQHAYYTKQDEQLLDDVTKQYFTIFGKKLPETVLQNTTPLYRVVATTTENPISHNVNTYVSNNYNNVVEPSQQQRFKPPKVKVHYGDQTQRPYSLEGDTLVNYKNPLPPINPDAEFISITNKPITNSHRQLYRPEQIPSIANRPNGNFVPISNPRETYRGRYTNPPISLANDIAVNYRDPRPPINPDAEFITPVQGQGSQPNRGGGSYFAYQLPGNGGHFYFLTPQAIPQQRQDVNGRQYIYPKSTPPRIIRRRRGPAEG